MTNRNKQQSDIHIILYNVPYTNEELEWRNKELENLRQTSDHARRFPELYQPLKTKPCHSYKYKPGVSSQEEARAFCEKEIKEGRAQAAQYSVYTFYQGKSHEAERYRIYKKGMIWQKVFGTEFRDKQ